MRNAITLACTDCKQRNYQQQSDNRYQWGQAGRLGRKTGREQQKVAA